jgi:hypothetical protein
MKHAKLIFITTAVALAIFIVIVMKLCQCCRDDEETEQLTEVTVMGAMEPAPEPAAPHPEELKVPVIAGLSPDDPDYVNKFIRGGL